MLGRRRVETSKKGKIWPDRCLPTRRKAKRGIFIDNNIKKFSELNLEKNIFNLG